MSAQKTTKSVWRTAPISRSCEVQRMGRRQCGKPATHAYQAAGGGWAALCEEHAVNIRPYCTAIEELLDSGETLAGGAEAQP